MKRIIIAAAAISAAASIAAPADAAVVVFTGYATGCFGASCTPSATATPGAQISTGAGGLVYTTSTFDLGGADHNSFVSSTNLLNQAGLSGGDIGYFTLGSTPANYNGIFNLLVTFTAPPGAGTATMTANVTGQVLTQQNGDVTIDFFNDSNNPLLLTYNGGAFSFYLNDLDIAGTSTVGTALTGKMTVAVPEPASWGLMLLGFAGIGAAMRRKRNSTLLPQLA
jgi:hypothetical protein